MGEILVAVLIFLCLTGVSLGCLFTYDRLPAQHRQDDTNTVVRLVANIFVVMTSLVLGLMLNSAKNSFETVDRNVHALATELILLDRTLRQYGPEANGVRAPLMIYVLRLVRDQSDNDSPSLSNKTSEQLLVDASTALIRLTPEEPEHKALLQDAGQHLQKAVELRWTLIEQSDAATPRFLIILVVAWLVLIFASFGYRAPRNAVVVTMFVVSAGLLASSLYLILDMGVPFTGPIQVSNEPMIRALAEMQR
ncbi:DUF4239 domain-containing protein [Kaistia dalseonensis]|uniref:DUF4239 domain-containing protein n=1 Tax=Kaistia dalseonensis TaxID=410840 RepID=A0ABU0HE66_9HYPH|nr:DUF4239 domain-containing protein [Kaistia dalseonensis]MCX5497504.1 DUF4239 domain-containing protein [Kaistia dalseonensis]MDQ0440143.1 hypothetical protein [Kaistia dalseonensis]